MQSAFRIQLLARHLRWLMVRVRRAYLHISPSVRTHKVKWPVCMCENLRGMPNSCTARDIALHHVRMSIRVGKNATRARRMCKLSRRMESTDSAVRVSILVRVSCRGCRACCLFAFSADICLETPRVDRDKKDAVRVKAWCFSTAS